jgi:hypothetical protein
VTKQLIAILIAVGVVGVANAQEKASAPAAANPTATPLKVQVTISRYQGDKKLSSMPYTLSVNTSTSTPGFQEVSRLRMGAKVPVMGFATPVVDGQRIAAGPISYQDVGTNIDCFVSTTEDGRYKVTVTVEDTSVYSEDQSPPTVKGSPTFRTFVQTNAAILRDGQSTQFASATDKVNGETLKIDVMLNVVK